MNFIKEQGLPAPEIKVVPPFVNLTIWFKSPLATPSGSEEGFQSPRDNADTPSAPPSELDKHPQSVNLSPQDRVLEFCRTPRSITEIANMLGVKDKKWVRKKYVSPLVGLKLQMTIPEKPNSQNQKYKTIE